MASCHIQLGETLIAPGERRSIWLPLPTLYSHSAMSMPVQVVNGRHPGPVLFVSGALHGDEINGVEIIRRLLKKPQLKRLRGALIAVPVVNVYGFVSQSRYLPDRRDLNRFFPGSESGSLAARLAHTLMQEVVSQCTHGIDLHTGAIGRENLPQIRARVSDCAETAAMAQAFGAPVILDAELREGSLRQAVSTLEPPLPLLLYESGEALRFDEVSIRAGVKGVIRVMHHLGMLPKRPTRRIRPASESLVAKASRWIRAPQSGILRTIAPLGSLVNRGDILGWISDPFGEKEVEVTARLSGIVIGKVTLPLVHEGEAVFHIGSFSDPDVAADSVEAFQERYNPDLDEAPLSEPVIV